MAYIHSSLALKLFDHLRGHGVPESSIILVKKALENAYLRGELSVWQEVNAKLDKHEEQHNVHQS